MPSEADCPNVERIRRSLDAADPMPGSERARIEQHVQRCERGCKRLIESFLGGNTLAAGGSTRSPVPPPTPPTPGRLPEVAGYEVLGELGRGAMGVVFRARQVALDRPVALKMLLRPAGEAEAQEYDRFAREALAVASLNHPGIVHVYELGHHGDAPFIAMELVAGGSLADRAGGVPQPPRRAAELTALLADAVQAAHDRGIVHRDLKPANVLLDPAGVPKVTDFGLAKRVGVESAESVGHFLGTPSYAAPEQVIGGLHGVGPATDVYGLGAILYELLTGRPPFRDATLWETLRQVVGSEPVPPSRLATVPRDLEVICLKCLAKESTRRYGSARELADDLRRFSAGRPIRARRVGITGRVNLWCRRNPALAGTLAAAALTVAALVAITGIHQAMQAKERAHEREAAYAAALVERLVAVGTANVPDIVAEIEACRPLADPLLREQNAAAPAGSRRKLHTSLALLPVDRGQVDYLLECLLRAEAHEVPVLREALAPHKDRLVDRLWAAVERPSDTQGWQRLPAACALAQYDPDPTRWRRFGGPIADDLVAANPAFLGVWLEGFRPARDEMIAPLSRIFRDPRRRETERTVATSLLTEYAADRPRVLADLLMEADENRFGLLFSHVRDGGEPAWLALEAEVQKEPKSGASQDSRDALARRRANAAVALSRLGRPDKVWPLLRHSPDPRTRSYLVHRLGPFGVDPAMIVDRLDVEPDVTARRALLCCLGEFGESALPAAKRGAMIARLRGTYEKADDPGLRGAAEWLLRSWNEGAWLERTDRELSADGPRTRRLEHIRRGSSAEPQWYVTERGQTMIVLPAPGEFRMGSPKKEAGRMDREPTHTRRIGRAFAIATKPVTVGQFLEFRKGHVEWLLRAVAPNDDCPVHEVTWFEAAEYCNWLSKQEGIPAGQWCYEADPSGRVTRLKAKYLSLKGYRLPTEAEWEYACRAGASTSRYFGESDDLLVKYGWSMRSAGERSWPVGLLKPNDFGLFDMHGNVYCWCQERYRTYPVTAAGRSADDVEDDLAVEGAASRVLRGGSWNSSARNCRSACRGFNVPGSRVNNFGFRVVIRPPG